MGVCESELPEPRDAQCPHPGGWAKAGGGGHRLHPSCHPPAWPWREPCTLLLRALPRERALPWAAVEEGEMPFPEEPAVKLLLFPTSPPLRV